MKSSGCQVIFGLTPSSQMLGITLAFLNPAMGTQQKCLHFWCLWVRSGAQMRGKGTWSIALACAVRAGMAALRSLWLDDNPLALSQLYRIDVLACFPEDQPLLLDGTRHSCAEHQTASLRAQVCWLSQLVLEQCSGPLKLTCC